MAELGKNFGKLLQVYLYWKKRRLFSKKISLLSVWVYRLWLDSKWWSRGFHANLLSLCDYILNVYLLLNLPPPVHPPTSWITYPGEGACMTQWRYEPWCTGPPKMDSSWWRVLRKYGPLEEEMANHSSNLAWRTPCTIWKGKKVWHQKSLLDQVSNILLGKSWGQLQIASERMKRMGQSGNTQL